MKLKDLAKRVFILFLAAGITVNSIPLLSLAATISQPDSGMAVIMEENTESQEEDITGEETEKEKEDEAGNESTEQETEKSEDGSETEEETGEKNENDSEVEEETEEDSGSGEEPEMGEEPEPGEEPEQETEAEEIELEGIAETEEEPDDRDLLEEKIKDSVQEAKDALEELVQSEYIMALVYLCDSYKVKAEPDFEAETVAVLKSGHTVLIQDIEVDTETMTIWYQVSFGIDDKEYTGYISKECLAYSGENFLAWEENYVEPILQLLDEFDDGASAMLYQALDTYSSDVSQFPSSYQAALQSLKDSHPNWTFVKFDTGLSWDTVVAAEMEDSRSLVYYTNNDAWKNGKYSSSWYIASKAAVEYCLDPRNGLTDSRIFQFEQLTFNASYHTVSAIQNILNNSFMSGIVPKASMSYAQAFYDIGKGRGISPFHLASRVLQEQGINGGSGLISGTYPGYTDLYNYYNINASGSTDKEVIVSGLTYAREQGWTTPYLSLSGGAAFIGNSYILKGQDTLYLQKFDVESAYNGLYWHQYMQNIQAPATEASTIRSLYNQSGSLDSTFVFKIPVYNNMPSAACPEPGAETLSFSASALSMKGGHSEALSYTISKMGADNNQIEGYTVSTDGIIEVGDITRTADGTTATGTITITALQPGTTELTVTTTGGGRAACMITVTEDGVTLSQEALSMNACSFDGQLESENVEITYTIDNAESSVESIQVDNTQLLEAEKISENVDAANDKLTGSIRLKALAPGTAKVTLTSRYGGVAAFTVTITRLPEKIEMDSEITICLGNSKIIRTNVFPEDTANKKLILESADETVASINPSTGRITGLSSGTTTITATTEENSLLGNPVSATCTVVVVPSVSYIEIAAEEVELLLGTDSAETFDLDGKLYLQKNLKGDVVLQEDTGESLYHILYQSSDESIVTVDEDGLITAVGIGSAVITATAEDQYSASGAKTVSCRVDVVPEKKTETIIPEYNYIQSERIVIYDAGTSRQITGNAFSLTTDGYIDLCYEVLPENASVESVSFESSNPSIAQVLAIEDKESGESGTENEISEDPKKGTIRITAGTKGKAVITIFTDIGIKKQINIIVGEKKNIEEVVLDQTSAVIYVNGTDGGRPDTVGNESLSSTVRLTALPQSDTQSGIIYKWTSTNENVAVVDSTGKVTAISPGSTVIFAEDTGGSGKYAKCTVKVESCLEEIKTGVDNLYLQPNKKVTINTVLSPLNVTSKKLKWESADEEIATVTDKGVVTVNKTASAGETTIITVTDTVTGLRKDIPLTVTTLSCAGVALYAEDKMVSTAALYYNGEEAEQSLLIKAAGFDAEKEIIDTLSFYAVSSNEKVAVVEPGRNENGEYDGTFQVTGKGKGTATIKVYAADGSNKSASVKVTVKVHPEAVTLQKEALYLKAGSSGTIGAAVMPSNADEKAVTWKFKNDASAEGITINAKTGKVTVAKGTAAGTSAEVVAVTNDGGVVSAACTVTVIGTKAGKVKLNTSSVVMAGSDITQMEAALLTAAVTPANADKAAARLKCTSSNEAVAVVEQNKNQAGDYDGTFKVTAVGYGMATITVQTLDNSQKATCKVYVSSLEKAYKISAVASTCNIQNYALDINSSCTLKIKDQFGNILDNSLFTFTSNKTDIAVVDEKGVVTPNKAYQPGKNGKAVITAALTGDPYGRKVKFTVNVLAKEQVENVSLTALNIRQNDSLEDLQNPESFVVKYPVTTDNEGNAVNTISLKAQALNVYGEMIDTKLKWSVSDTSIAGIKVNADTKEATLTVKKAGRFSVTCTAGDTLKRSRTVRITVFDGKPALEQSKITLNKQAETDELSYVHADSIRLIENRNSAIENVAVKEVKKGNAIINADDFKIEGIGDGCYSISVLESSLQNLKTGSYSAVLLVETAERPEIGLIGENGKITHKIPVTISIVDKKPKISVKTVSINRQNITQAEAQLTVTAPDEVESIELITDQSNRFDSIFAVKEENGSFRIGFQDMTGYTSGSITGKASVKVKGYRPVTVNIKVSTPLTKASIAALETPSMDVNNGNSQTIGLYNKTTKQNLTNYKIVEVPADAKLEIANEKNEDGTLKPNRDGTLTLKPRKDVKYTNGGTVSFTVRVMALSEDGKELWASAADVKISVKTYTAAPTVSLSSATLTLNRQAAGEAAQTAVKTNRSNVRIADDDEWQISCYDSAAKAYKVVKKFGESAESTADNIIFSYNRQEGLLTARMKEGADINTGKYKYRITWIAEDYSRISRDVTVSVVDKQVTAKITAKGKLDLLTRSASTMQGTVSLSNTGAGIKSIMLMEADEEGSYRANSSFYSTWLGNKVFRIRLKEGAVMTAGKKTVPVRITLEGGTVLYSSVSFTISQSTPKVTIPKTQTIYKSAGNTTVIYNMNEQIPTGYEISAIETASKPAGIGVTIKDGQLFLSLADRSLKPGTYSIKVNMYFKGAQYVFGSHYGKAFQKTLKVTIKE